MKISTIITTLTQDTTQLQNRKDAADVVKHLYAAYGKVASKKEFRDTIGSIDEYTSALLSLLVEHQMFNYHTIKTLTSSLRQAYEKQHHTVHVHIADKHEEKAKQKRENTQTHSTNHLGVTVRKDGKVYKRALHTDIQKLLNA